MALKDHAARWKRDPVAFIRDVLRDSQSGQPFTLYPAEERFFREAFTVTEDSRLPNSEIVFSAPKKSGKTCIAGVAAIYVAAVIGGPYAEVYCLSNDYEQSVGRVFEQARRIIEASPLLRGSVKVTADRLLFRSTGSFIQACASDYSGFAGSNPSLTIFDELWGYVHEASRRLYDEAVPSPVRKVSARLVVTYAGFTSESDLLESLYRRLVSGDNLGEDFYRHGSLYGCWTSELRAPWQSPEWVAELREQLRPSAFARLVQNQWVSAESSFVSMEDWDGCVESTLTPLYSEAGKSVWVGLDASVRGDQTAIAVCSWEREIGKVRLLWHRAIQPSRDRPIDFEHDIADTLRELRQRYDVRSIIFDPFQMESTYQQLLRENLPMEPYNQTVPGLTVLANNLYTLVRARGLVVYPADDLRQAVLSTAVTESERGFKLSKLKQSRKIDLCVSPSMAALGASRHMGVGGNYAVQYGDPIELLRGGVSLAEQFGLVDLRDPYLDERGQLRPEVAAEKARRLGESDAKPSTIESDSINVVRA